MSLDSRRECNIYMKKVLLEAYGSEDVLRVRLARTKMQRGCTKFTALLVLFCMYVQELHDMAQGKVLFSDEEDKTQKRSFRE